MNFVALDFETANYTRSSICSVGIAIVENGKVKRTISQLIKPTPNYYIDQFVDIHGITPAMTNKQPDFKKIWNDIRPHIENKIVVAHNAGFDFGALRNVLDTFNLAYPELNYYCSVVISRKTYSALPNHKLSTVCRHLKIALKHHDAESDAIGAAEIVLHACKRNKVNSFEELAGVLNIKAKRL